MLHILALIILAALITFVFIVFFGKRIEVAPETFPNAAAAQPTVEVPAGANLIYTPPTKVSEGVATEKYATILAAADTWSHRVVANAIAAAKQNHGPFAAIILQIDAATNEVIRYWQAHNEVVATCDPTAHAEVQVIRQACAELNCFALNNIQAEESSLPQPSDQSYCVLYASCEPCPMCMAACYWAQIPRVIFSATEADAKEHANFADEQIAVELTKAYAERELVSMQYAPCADNITAFNIHSSQSEHHYGQHGKQHYGHQD